MTPRPEKGCGAAVHCLLLLTSTCPWRTGRTSHSVGSMPIAQPGMCRAAAGVAPAGVVPAAGTWAAKAATSCVCNSKRVLHSDKWGLPFSFSVVHQKKGPDGGFIATAMVTRLAGKAAHGCLHPQTSISPVKGIVWKAANSSR